MPVPKSSCQKRLTVTRAVKGCSGSKATSRSQGDCAEHQKASQEDFGRVRGTLSRRLSYSPRTARMTSRVRFLIHDMRNGSRILISRSSCSRSVIPFCCGDELAVVATKDKFHRLLLVLRSLIRGFGYQIRQPRFVLQSAISSSSKHGCKCAHPALQLSPHRHHSCAAQS